MRVPLYLYNEQGRCYGYSLHEVLISTASTCSHETACRRGGREVSVGGRATLGVGHPLSKPPRHRLCVVGCGLDMVHSSVGFSPKWVELMGVFIVPLRKSASKSAFQWMFPCICIYVLQNKWEHQNSWNLLDKIIFCYDVAWNVVILMHFGGQNIWVKDRQQAPSHLDLCSSHTKVWIK